MLKEAFSKITFSSLLWPCAQVVCGKRGGGTKKAFPPQRKQRILTKNGLYPAGATAGTALRGPAAGGSTGRPEEKMPRAFRFKPGIKLACC